MDEASVDRFISTMMDAPYIAVDTEATGLSVKDGRDYLMGISVAYRVGDLGIFSAYFALRHESGNLDRTVVEKIRAVFDRVPLAFHNLKFDLHSLATIGIEPKANCYDTMVITHMLNEELPSKELDWLSRIFLKDEKQRSEQFVGWIKAFGWSSIPPGLMEPYAKHDAELTLRLFELFWPKMREQELAGLWPYEQHFTRLLRKMERRGVRVNKHFCEIQAEYGRARMAAITNELGFEVSRTSLLSDYLLNQLKLPVLKISTKTGNPSFDKKTMEEYDRILEVMDRPDAKLIAEYRGWMKVVTSFYEPIVRLTGSDGRVRTNYTLHRVKTSRLSSERPNLQQIPRSSNKPWNGNAKEAFVPEPGYKLIEADYAQLEYRLACVYAGEPELLRTFNEGKIDIFTKGAADVFGDGADSFRNTFKTYSYAKLYGAGIEKIALTLGVSLERAEEIATAVNTQYPNLARAAREVNNIAKRKGYIRLWTGRRRHFPNGDGSHKAWNSLLQGGGAELVKRAMLRIDNELDCDDARMVMQIHDSVVLEVKEELVPDVSRHLEKLMTDFPNIDVKLKVDIHVWGK